MIPSVSGHGTAHTRIEVINKEIAKDEDNAELYLKRGRVYADTRHWEDAINDFKKTKQLDPNFIDADFWLGVVYFESGKLNKAKNYLESYLKIKPNAAQPLLYYARLHAKLGQNSAAEMYFDKAITAWEVKYPELYIERARHMLKSKPLRFSLIEKGLAEGVQEVGKVVSLIDELIRISMQAKKYERAIYWMAQWPDSYKKTPLGLSKLAGVYELNGDYDIALATYQKCLDAINKLPQHRQNVVAITELSNQAKNAIRKIRKSH